MEVMTHPRGLSLPLLPLLLLPLLPPSSAPSSPSCPSPCSCYLPPLTVSCQSLGLSLPPGPLPPSTTRLLLQANAISELGPEALPMGLTTLLLHSNNLSLLHPSALAPLALLEVLDLGGNPTLLSLPPTAFSGLVRLRALHLNGCGLAVLPPGLFFGLGALRYLYLQDNGLVRLQPGIFLPLGNLTYLFLHGNRLLDLGPEAFLGLASLDRLLLHRNRLSQVHPRAFSGLAALRTLYLFENRLPGLPAASLSSLLSLCFLRLGTNPWLCDCRVRPLWEWFGAYRGASDPVSCSQPRALSGRDLRGLREAEIPACGKRELPGASGGPQAWLEGSGLRPDGRLDVWLLPLTVWASTLTP